MDFFPQVITVMSTTQSILDRDSQFMFTAGGGEGNNDVKNVIMKVHETCKRPGP